MAIAKKATTAVVARNRASLPSASAAANGSPSAAAVSFWRRAAAFLAAIVFFQWAVVASLIAKTQQPHHGTNPVQAAFVPSSLATVPDPAERNEPLEGVAATLLLRNPKWFHRRYGLMINNVVDNLPDGWAVQVFVNDEWMKKDVYPYHPGLERMLSPSARHNPTANRPSPPIIVTPLPANMTHRKTKPKDVFKSRWFWNSVAADNVFLFGGNGAVCGNHRPDSHDWDLYTQYDFVGVPSPHRFSKAGGDGSTHSFRHRSAMLSVLDEFPVDDDDDIDSSFFLRRMIRKNEEKQSSLSRGQQLPYKLADPSVSFRFGGIKHVDADPPGVPKGPQAPDPVQLPLVLSGTLANLEWSIRDTVLNICPELKAIFPSLHEPSCFGAHPNGEQCKATICALQDVLPSSGC